MPSSNQIGAEIVVTGNTKPGQSAVQELEAKAKTLRAELKQKGLGDEIEHLEEKLHQAAGADELKDKLQELSAKVPGLSGSIGALGNVAEAVAAGPMAVAALSVGTLVSAFELAEKAVEAFEEKQERVTRLDAALAQQGLLTDEYREKLQKLSSEYGEATGQGTQWLDVLAKLTQYGADSTNIEKYAEAVKNLSGLLGGNTERAAQIFGRAINGNTGVLHRFGIEIDKSKDSAAQLDDIMEQLAQRGGGQLEAQTQTLAGKFRTLEEGTEELFAAIGNLINESGLLQEIINDIRIAIELLKRVFPEAIPSVEGFTNKARPLRDELGHVKVALDDAGDSAELADEQLDDSADGAKKAADAYKEAADAAKKLREQQDAMADAKTSLALANVDAAEAGGAITAEDANKQRADIRASAEREKIEREIKEQGAIIKLQEDREGKQHAIAAADADNQSHAEASFRAQIAYSGRPDAEKVASDPSILEAAKKRAEDVGDQLESIGPIDPQKTPEDVIRRAEALKKERSELAQEIEVIGALRSAYDDLQQAKANAAKSSADDSKTQSEAGGVIGDARAKLAELAVREQAGAIKASTEQAKIAADAKKKADDKAKKDADDAAKNADDIRKQQIEALKAGQGNYTPEQRAGLLARLQKQSDDYASRDDSPQLRDLSLRNRQREEDAKDPAAAALNIARNAAQAQGNGPGTVSGAAAEILRKAAAAVAATGGKDKTADARLESALLAFIKALEQANLPTRPEVNDLARRLDQLSSQFQKSR